jgi:hypothetical protein
VLVEHGPVRADSGFRRAVDNPAFEVELLLHDRADGKSEEMRIRICDQLAPGQKLRGDTIEEQLDLDPIARRKAGSFASPALTIRIGDAASLRPGHRVEALVQRFRLR